MRPVVLAIHLLAAPAPDASGAALFAEAHYAEAASVFEANWSTDPDLVALAWAGRSRLRAGHAAHAVTYLTHALAGALPDDLRKQALADLASARARTHPTQVHLELHDPPGRLTVVARRTSVDAPALVHDLTPPPGVTTHILVLDLDPDEWTLELRRGDELRTTRIVKITASQPPIRLAEPRPTTQPIRTAPDKPDRPPPRRTRLALAGGITGGVLSLVGTGLLIHTQTRVSSTPDSPSASCPFDCSDYAALFGLRATGAGLLGAGVGIAAASLPALAPSYTRRRAVWATELSLGALAVAGGISIAGRNGLDFNTSPDHGPTDFVMLSATYHSAGTALLGLGLGLVTTATAALIADAVTKRRGLRATLTPTLTGVVLTGRF